MPIPLETLLEEAKCLCAAGGSTSERAIMALLQRIADAGGGGGGTPGGAANSVQFNDAGAFGGFGSFNSGTSVLTIPGDLIFNTDNADDIGASGASRPRTGYFGTSVVTPLLTILAAANAEAINVSGYSLTGASAQGMLALSGTWNTSGNPVAIRLAITNTASGANARFLEFFAGAAGATSVFQITKAGNIFAAGLIALGPSLGGQASISSISGSDGLRFSTGFTARWDVNSTGHFIAFADNTYDIGASGATRPRTGYFGTSVLSPVFQTTTALNTAVDGGLTAAFTANMVGSTGGPTTAAQNGWQMMRDSAGATVWVPVWK